MTRHLRARELLSRFVPLSVVPEGPARGRLGVVRFAGTSFNPVLRDGHPELTVHMAEDAGRGFAEVWTSSRRVESGEHKAITYAHDGEYLFCAGRIPPCDEHTYAGRLAFRAALELAGKLGYHHVFRMWNYLQDLTPRTYREFLLGQAEAFARRPVTWSGLTAATVVGSRGGGIAFHFLACRTGEPVTIISPSGARGVHVHGRLFFSAPSLDDAEELMSAANLANWGVDDGFGLHDISSLKVYARQPGDLALAGFECDTRLESETSVAFMQATLLPGERAVEFEGVAG
ncbi:chorismate transformation enzyme, FkbO/Hyg5 family [Lentzea sp. NPDC054927]